MLGLTDPIDIVISGINPNANIGHDVTYSGTVTAAMEAVIDGVKGIAVSLHSPEGFKGQLDYSTAALVARRVAEKVMSDGLPEGVVLNVNVPYLKEKELKGYMVTRRDCASIATHSMSASIRAAGRIIGLAVRRRPAWTNPAPISAH